MKRLLLASGFLAGCGVVGVLYFFDPDRVPIYPVCQFHRITGWDCPGCGGLRATHALLHGQFAEAVHFNLLLVLSVPLCAFLGVRYGWRRSKGKAGLGLSPAWVWAYLVAWIAFGVLRNLPVHALAVFAP